MCVYFILYCVFSYVSYDIEKDKITAAASSLNKHFLKLAQIGLAQHRAVTAGVLSCCFAGADKCPLAAAAPLCWLQKDLLKCLLAQMYVILMCVIVCHFFDC